MNYRQLSERGWLVGRGQSLGRDVPVDAPEAAGGGAVNVEPPVAGEVLLLEEGPVGTEEAHLVQASLALVHTHVEGLAVCLRVCVVAALHLTSAAEQSGGHSSQDWVVSPRHSWHPAMAVSLVTEKTHQQRAQH